MEPEPGLAFQQALDDLVRAHCRDLAAAQRQSATSLGLSSAFAGAPRAQDAARWCARPPGSAPRGGPRLLSAPPVPLPSGAAEMATPPGDALSDTPADASVTSRVVPRLSGLSIESAPPSPTSKGVAALAQWERVLGRLFDLMARMGPLLSDLPVRCPDYEMLSCWLETSSQGTSAHDMRTRDLVADLNMAKSSGQVLQHAGIMQRYVLHPHSLQRCYWALLGILFLVWDLLLIPLQVCNLDGFSASLTGLAVVALLYWSMDLAVQGLTGYWTSDGAVEMRPAMTVVRYLRGWFGADVIILACDIAVFFVLDLGQWGYDSEGSAEVSTSLLRMIRIARLVKLMRFGRFQELRELSVNLADSYFSQSVKLRLTVCQWFFAVLVLNHVVACAWFAIADFSSNGTTWIRSAAIGVFDEDSKWESYMLAMHWSLTQFGPSTQNITPTNTQERVFACAVVFVGLGVFSTIISSITSAVNQLRFVNMDSLVEESKLREFLTSRGISAGLYGSITSFFKNTYRKNDARVFEGDVRVFSELPASLLMQMHAEVYMSKLCANPGASAFYGMHCELLRHICHEAMSERSVLAGHDMFFPREDATSLNYTMNETLVYDAGYPTGLKGVLRMSEYLRLYRPHNVQRVPSVSWLSEMAMWCKWKHRGHLQAKATAHVICVDVREVEVLAAQAPRDSIAGMRIFAILLVDQVERMESGGEKVSDLPLDPEVTREVASRAKRLMRIRPSLAGRLVARAGTTP